jgi:hypothetical protein
MGSDIAKYFFLMTRARLRFVPKTTDRRSDIPLRLLEQPKSTDDEARGRRPYEATRSGLPELAYSTALRNRPPNKLGRGVGFTELHRLATNSL